MNTPTSTPAPPAPTAVPTTAPVATATPTIAPTTAPVATATTAVTASPNPTGTPEATTSPTATPEQTDEPNDEEVVAPVETPTTGGNGGTPSVGITPDGGVDLDTGNTSEPPVNVQIDGKDLSEDLYTFEDGKLNILPEAFEGLDDGEHTVTVEYADKAPTQTAVITDNGVPLSANVVGFAAWSLFDLLMTILTFILAVLYLLRKKYKANDDEDENYETEEEKEKYKKQRLIKVIGILLFVVTLIFLLVTQDFTLPMIIFDKYSLAFAILALVQLLAGILTAKRNKKQDEDAKNA